MNLHDKQKAIVASDARFKVARAGRKGGKTALEVEVICYKALVSASKLNLTKTTFASGRKVLYIAPTMIQARNIIWSALKSRLHGIGTANEATLQMKVPNEDGEQTTIFVGGWENRENYRGMTDVVHITFDETDTLKDFFLSWLEIFRPMFLDTGGSADFVGTPKKESGNLKRLEKEAQGKLDWECFHFTSRDNPFLAVSEIDAMEKEYERDRESYRQEVLAEYIENAGALFKYDALVDVFSNTITKENAKYLTVDIADDGTDKTKFSFWEGLEEYRREEFERLNTEGIIQKIREYASQERIPYSNIAVDAIGVGAGVASSSQLDGIIGYKSSFAPIKTDLDPTRLPNVSYTSTAPLTSDYKNLRSQCVFVLADHVNNHKVASKVTGRMKEAVIEELSTYQDASTGDGKRMATMKEDVKAIIGRSPDDSDCFVAGTRVTTPKGYKNIEDIKIGDYVTTPFGSSRVVGTIMKKSDTIYQLDTKLVGTGNHRIFSGSIFSTLDNYMMSVYTYYTNNAYNKIIWKVLSLLSTKIKSIGFRVLVDTSITAHTKTDLDKKELHCIGRSGKILTHLKSLMGMMYTILTVILLIITRTIWLLLNLANIIENTLKSIGKTITKKQQIILTKQEKWLLSGMGQKMEENGTQKTLKKCGLPCNVKLFVALGVVKSISLIEKVVTALIVAAKSLIIEIKNITKIENVSLVDMILVSGSLNIPVIAHVNVPQRVDGVKVYTLSLEEQNVYFANDILVANCWIMRMYFEVRKKMLPDLGAERSQVIDKQIALMRAKAQQSKSNK